MYMYKKYLCHQLFPLWGKCLLHLIFFLVPIFPHLNPLWAAFAGIILLCFIFLNPRANKIKVVLKLKDKGYMENKSVSTLYTKLNHNSQKITSDTNMSPMFCYLWKWEGYLKIQWHDWKIMTQFHSWLKDVMIPLKKLLKETFDTNWFEKIFDY